MMALLEIEDVSAELQGGFSDIRYWEALAKACRAVRSGDAATWAYELGQEVGDTEKAFRMYTFFQTVFLLALLVVC